MHGSVRPSAAPSPLSALTALLRLAVCAVNPKCSPVQLSAGRQAYEEAKAREEQMDQENDEAVDRAERLVEHEVPFFPRARRWLTCPLKGQNGKGRPGLRGEQPQ